MRHLIFNIIVTAATINPSNTARLLKYSLKVKKSRRKIVPYEKRNVTPGYIATSGFTRINANHGKTKNKNAFKGWKSIAIDEMKNPSNIALNDRFP